MSPSTDTGVWVFVSSSADNGEYPLGITKILNATFTAPWRGPYVSLRESVLLDTHGQDKYKRTLGDVFLRDGMHVNHELVKDGWCWWYRKYAPGDTMLEGLEKEAREAKQGCGPSRTRCRRGSGGSECKSSYWRAGNCHWHQVVAYGDYYFISSQSNGIELRGCCRRGRANRMRLEVPT
jgi:hypothetical protein